MTPDDTSVQTILLWVLALSTIVSFCTSIWTLVSGPSRKNTVTLEEHGKQLGDMRARLAAIEGKQGDAPSRKDFHDLEVTMTELRGTMAVLTERLKPVEAITDRLQEWMMEMGKK